MSIVTTGIGLRRLERPLDLEAELATRGITVP
jgi:hypothetical protein